MIASIKPIGHEDKWPHRRCDKGKWEYKDTEGNSGYRDSEYQVWKYEKGGGDCPIMKSFIRSLHSGTLHKANVALGRLSLKTEMELSRIARSIRKGRNIETKLGLKGSGYE